MHVGNQLVDAFYVKMSSGKRRGLLCYSYNWCRSSIDFNIETMSQDLALSSSQHENFITIRDFKVEKNDSDLLVVTNSYDLNYLNWSFHHFCVMVTGLPDFCNMTVTVMTKTFEKLQLEIEIDIFRII